MSTINTTNLKNPSSAVPNIELDSAGGAKFQQIKGGALTLGTAQASTSGTSIDFTGIPSWVKRITVMFSGVSLSGTSSVQVQIGAGSIAASGYAGGTTGFGTTSVNTNNYTSGLVLFIPNETSNYVRHGVAVFTLLTGNTWVGNGQLQNSFSTFGCSANASLALSGTLDRIRITTVNGTDTFDAGTINILYEG